ncbi:MAG: hypothetical protein K0Q94_3776 [Paenibacillus sp.]|nr:hypothetical protein [Paenibacillus sp.]
MAMITLRPDLKTAGGEVTELLLDGRFVGAMTLVYREGGRISGSVQLDLESLGGSRKADAVSAAQNYVEHLMDALAAKECEVIVTCSGYDHIITAGHQLGVIESFTDESDYYEQISGEEDETRLDDIDPNGIETMEMHPGVSETGIELVIVGESRNRVEYHIYDSDQEWLAEAFVRVRGADVIAEIDWKVAPTDEELEHITDLLVSDFDSDEVDTFLIEMKLDGEMLETIELTHEDLLVADDFIDDETYISEEAGKYSVILVRDDGDTLTYDLYEQSQGGLPIGQATVDVSSRELTGFIDFRDPGSTIDGEFIGSLLMHELDKEKDYESLNLTMLVNNEPIDEILFETEIIH